MAKITLDKLAEMIQTGFSTLEARILGVENTQSEMLMKMDQYAYKLDVEDLKRRVTKLENRK